MEILTTIQVLRLICPAVYFWGSWAFFFMIQHSKDRKITMTIQLLTWSCLKRVKTTGIGAESFEASARALALCLFFNPTSRDSRVVTVLMVFFFMTQKLYLQLFLTIDKPTAMIWLYSKWIRTQAGIWRQRELRTNNHNKVNRMVERPLWQQTVRI